MEKELKYQQLVHDASCIIFNNEISLSMAFAISDKYLLSVGHCFNTFPRGSKFKARFANNSIYDVKVVYTQFDTNLSLDFSILCIVNALLSIEPLPIKFPINASGKFISIGNSPILPYFSAANGEIIGHYEAQNSDNFFFKLDSKHSGQIGFSGAPIFSLNEQAVIAIQCEATETITGPERDTVLAFPLARLLNDNIARKYINTKSSINLSELIQNYLLPSFGRSLLCLELSDNLQGYMRCIVVKLMPERNERFTVFVAGGSNDIDTIVGSVRQKHPTRKMKYGVVGGMLKVNVPLIYDFVNEKCYQLDLGGTSKLSSEKVLTLKNRGAKEDRIALLVAPIRDKNGTAVGVLSFDFFSVTDDRKNIINSNFPHR